MAEGIKEKKAGCCEYQYWNKSYCGRMIDNNYLDSEGRKYCIFHSHKDDKEEEFYKIINEAIDIANEKVRKAIDAINKEKTEQQTREEKIKDVRREKRLDFEGFYFPGTADFSKKIIEPYTVFTYATFSGVADFFSATFSGAADFIKATFSGAAGFSGATFHGAARFWSATFSRVADFREATFNGEASFWSATFSGVADFEWATFGGEARFYEVTFSGEVDFIFATFSGKADFTEATFSGEATFHDATFSRVADFSNSTFSGEADFTEASFSGEADFRWATFSGEADFSDSTFSGKAYFTNTDFIEDVNFYSATFNKTYFSGTDLKRVSLNRASLHLCFIDDIRYSNRTMKGIFIDTFTANTNRIFARDAADYNYIIDMQKKCDRLKRNSLIFFKDENLTKEGLINRLKWELLRTGMDLWKITSNYGRSFALWFAWSLGIALLFGFFYLLPLQDQLHYGRHTTITIEKSLVEGRPVEKLNDKLKPYDDLSWFTPFYYSIVTFTTLGFGDVVPDTGVARAVVALEVFLGYIMLGGLISIFANKLARRA